MAQSRNLVPVKVGGRTIEVTPQLKAAVEKLPADLRRNLRTPKGNRVMTKTQLAELRKAGKVYSTVMCPW